MQNLGIVSLEYDAFADTNNLSILLSGNSVSQIFPGAFSLNNVRGGQNCKDFVGWAEYCEFLKSEITCDQTSCSNYTSPYVVSSLGVRAVDACCALGGGHQVGANLIMDETSPMICFSPEDSSSLVICECNDDFQRYDIETSSCISSCESGERWEFVLSDLYEIIESDVGRCVPCLAGTYCSRILAPALNSHHSLISQERIQRLTLHVRI